jgi:hypothetical protein
MSLPSTTTDRSICLNWNQDRSKNSINENQKNSIIGQITEIIRLQPSLISHRSLPQAQFLVSWVADAIYLEIHATFYYVLTFDTGHNDEIFTFRLIRFITYPSNPF